MIVHVLIYETLKIKENIIISNCKLFYKKEDLNKFLESYLNSHSYEHYDQVCDYYTFEQEIE